MENQKTLISEAKLSSGVALAATPIILAIVVSVAGLFERGLEAGIYYGAFGPLIYIIFFGGLGYAFYEFTKIIRGRLHYLTYQDGCLHVLEQEAIRIDQVRSITIERNFFWENLVLKTSDRRAVRIRGYLLQRDLNEVKNSIEMLQKSVSA